MSMHRIPLSKVEEAGLRAHGLDIGTPSQLSDAFRQGLKYGQSESAAEIVELKRQLEEAKWQAAFDGKLLNHIESELIGVQYVGHYDAGIRAIKQQLAESQAREAKLREAIEFTRQYVGEDRLPPLPGWSWFDALALPHDDTALKEYIEKALHNSSKDV